MKSLLLAFILALLTRPGLAIQTSTIKASVLGVEINVYLYEPAGTGPFPLIILSHGNPRKPEDRANFGPQTLHVQAMAYAASGVAVAVPIRRGYGGNGAWVEGFTGPHKDSYLAGLTSADDIDAAIDAISKRPEIDPSRVVLMGISAGGWASLAAATRGHVRGVVNFAGGRGSTSADHVFNEPELLHAVSLYGAASTGIPELWIYSQNDHFFGPDLAHRMFDTFTAAGGQATFIEVPPYGDDGHNYITAVPSWKPHVDAFLRKIGFLQ